MPAKPAWGTWTTVALRVCLGAGILSACFLLPDMSALPIVIANTDPVWVSVALSLAVVGTVVLPALTTREALAVDRIRLTLGELIRINFTTRFYVIVLPRAASIGIRWLRYTEGGDAHDAFALMVYERLMQLFTMTLIGTGVLALEIVRLGKVGIAVLGASIACTAVLGALLLPFLLPSMSRWLGVFGNTRNRLVPRFLATRAQRLLEAVSAFHALSAPTTLKVLAYSIIAYVLFIASPYALAIAMNTGISPLALAWIRPLVFLLTMLPFTVAGLGVREAGFIGLLHLYGIAPSEALAFSLMLFAIQVAIGLVGMILEISRRAIRCRPATP